MAPRLQLQTILKAILGSNNVYFQPPSNIQMSYPCIVYKRSDIRTEFADNVPYNKRKRYQVTVIDQNPDSEIPDKVAELPMASYDRSFTADNLNHDVFNLFF